VFAGYGGIVGEKHAKAADRSIRKLAKLMDQSAGVLTVALRSLARVAGFVMKQMEDDEPIEEKEIAFLKSFARLVERVCADQYERELRAVRS
jgi:hypothetical protein